MQLLGLYFLFYLIVLMKQQIFKIKFKTFHSFQRKFGFVDFIFNVPKIFYFIFLMTKIRSKKFLKCWPKHLYFLF